MKVEVVRRFIHDDDMGTREEHFREGDFGTFSARESTDGLMPFLILDEEAAEHGAYFLIFIVTFCELVHDSRFAVEVGEDL
jgi:hypothetical protein